MDAQSHLSLDPSYDSIQHRRVFPVNNPIGFFNRLYSDLHLGIIDKFSKESLNFTMFLNPIDRTKLRVYEKHENIEFIYAGLDSQQALLEKDSSSVASSWKMLKETTNIWEGTPEFSETKLKYDKFRLGKLDIDDITVENLNGYFSKDISNLQKEEKTILETNFDLTKDKYISIPLIGFADFDGMVHIIFENKYSELFEDRKNIEELILIFSRIYENVFFNWSGIGEKEKSIYTFTLNNIKNPSLYDVIYKNPILKELNYSDRYKKYNKYYLEKLESLKIIPPKLYVMYLRQAITATLMDSYAHNISAHSLTALSWWFRKRAELQSTEKTQSEIDKDWKQVFRYLPDTLVPINEDGARNLKNVLKTIQQKRAGNSTDNSGGNYAGEGGTIVQYPGHLSRELSPLFNFLMEKGAYWSGITRDQNIGGKVSSLFSVLWYNFVNNPLYLCTIAKTEDIKHIKFSVTVYEPEKLNSESQIGYKKKVQCSGIFAEINLSKRRTEPVPEDAPEWLRMRSMLVEPGKEFDILKLALEKARLYFPGGVVGKHAFFTMIENEIRNIKHFHGEALRDMQVNGLTLELSIQPIFLPNSFVEEGAEELYRIGIGIKAPSNLISRNNEHLVERKWHLMNNELTDDETHAPKLGGTYQDKICAALLFNSSFSSVQNGFAKQNRNIFENTELEKAFFPWITPSCLDKDTKMDVGTEHIEYKINIHNHEKLIPVLDKFPKEGFLMKNFYMWKGANMHLVTEKMLPAEDAYSSDTGKGESWENYSRFRIITVSEGDSSRLMLQLRSKGVVRIINDWKKNPKDDKDDFVDAYRLWLQKWIKSPVHAFLLVENTSTGTEVNSEASDSLKKQALLVLTSDKNKCKVYSADQLNTLNPDDELKGYLDLVEKNKENCILQVEHKPDYQATPDTLQFRSHGTYKTYFLRNQDSLNDTIAHHKDRLFELFEVLATQICIFDNRIWHRIRDDYKKYEGNKGESAKDAPQKDSALGYEKNIRRNFYYNKLGIMAHAEGAISDSNWYDDWDLALKEEIPNTHFLILHLSFIEAILAAKYSTYEGYKPGNIGLFIEKELLPHIMDSNGNVRDNFFLVITTGRGNSNWLESLNSNPKYKAYFRFTIFRPIESMLSSIDNSISQNDDIELKYRLCKLLFGS